jgi:hypothetical protein
MTEDHEVPGLTLFDERATAVGGFPNAVLGYDKSAVDAYVRQLERQVLELRRQAREQSEEHELVKSQATATDLTRLTGHAAVLLNSAESHSEQLTTEAQLEAQSIRESARRDGEELRAGGQQEADDLRATAMANLRRLRDKQTEELRATLAAARQEADQVVASGTRHSEAVVRQANQQAASIVAAAEVEAARILQEAKTAAAAAHAQAAQVLVDATAQHEAATKLLAEESDAAAQIRVAAGQDAEGVRIQAVREAEQHLAATRAAGAQLRARLDAEAERRKDQLVAEIAALAHQKKAIQAQLGELVGIGQKAAAVGEDAQAAWPAAMYPADEVLPGPEADTDQAAAKAGKRKTRTKQTPAADTTSPEPDDAGDEDTVQTVIRERDDQ